MADGTTQLKRKRESTVGQQKKAKKARKSDALGTSTEAVTTTPTTEPTREPQATPTPRDKTNPELRDPRSSGNAEQAERPETTVDATAKKSKKQRRQEEKDSKPQQPHNAIVTTQVSAPSTAQIPRSTKSKKQKNKTSVAWTVSQAQGGWFLPTDPIFSLDEKYLILAKPKALEVYSADTSLLASVLPVSIAHFITAYALSSTNSNQIYVADSSGLVTLWDWTECSKVGRWDVGAIVRNMAVVTRPGSDEDLVYCHETGDRHIVNVHALRTKAQAAGTELKCVLEADDKITGMQVLSQGKYVVISTADSITFGKRLKVTKTSVQDFEYVWRELKFSKRITACNTFFRQPGVAEKGKKQVQDQRDILDLAVGDEIGVVLLFEDILASFAALERNRKGSQGGKDDAESLRPKRLHWHRQAVGSVKWSLDGNYVISGGDETVLTIWQLATGKPQHLPHLTAAIESIVVSPLGSSYALSLANNSVIVLSTTELEARTNIIGVQTRRVDPEQLPRDSKSLSTSVLQPVPMVVDPKNPHQVLFSVPSSQPRQRNVGLRSEPFLQTFDVAGQRTVNRQALTRNNATDSNMDPEGRRIIEPNVKFIKISHDGQWLATVDEWVPHKADTAYLNEGDAEYTEEERMRRREVYLKLWRWDERNRQWTLETRLDAPHFQEDACGNGRIVDLAAHPTEVGFATLGEDHVVRIWKPKTRLRDGLIVRGACGRGLVNWSLHRFTELPKPNRVWLGDSGVGPHRSRTCRLQFSTDGSILVAGISGISEDDHGHIHIIDADSATIRRSLSEINATVLCDLGVIGRHLIVVTDRIVVWDMVHDDLVYYASITTAGLNEVNRASILRLAVNHTNSTFAVSLPQFETNDNSRVSTKKVSSKVTVYSINQQEPIWSQTIPGITLGLAAREAEKGYLALDSGSYIRNISPNAGHWKLPSLLAAGESDLQTAMETQEEMQGDTVDKAFQLEDIVLENDYDKPIVTQQDFEEIFHTEDAPQTATDVFGAMLSLFGGVVKAAA